VVETASSLLRVLPEPDTMGNVFFLFREDNEFIFSKKAVVRSARISLLWSMMAFFPPLLLFGVS